MKRLRVDEMEKKWRLSCAGRTSGRVQRLVKNLILSGCAVVRCGKTLRDVRQRP
jgi:hypothetical protein